MADGKYLESCNSSLLEVISREKVVDAYDRIGLDVRAYLFEDLQLWKCDATGVRFFLPLINLGGNEFYQMLSENRGNYYDKRRWEHEFAIKLVSQGQLSQGRVFEFGCGPGYFLERLPKGFERYGFDFNPTVSSALKVKKINYLALDDLREFDGKFNYIFIFQVLEHLSEPNLFLEAAFQKLRPGGRLVVGVPNSNPFLYKRDKLHALNLPPHHEILFDSSSLVRFVESFGFENVSVSFEPLRNCKHYFEVQATYFFGTKFAKLATRFVYSPLSFLWDRVISRQQGRNIVAVFKKAKC